MRDRVRARPEAGRRPGVVGRVERVFDADEGQLWVRGHGRHARVQVRRAGEDDALRGHRRRALSDAGRGHAHGWMRTLVVSFALARE